MTRYRIDVPPFLVTYVEQTARRTAERVVIRFHRWLLESGKTLSKITGRDVEEFVEKPAGKLVAQLTRNDYRYEARPLPSVLVDVLRRHRRDEPYQGELVFPNDRGELYTKNGKLEDVLRAALTKVGLPRIRLHDLRHVYGAHFVMAGGSIYDLQRNLGHHSVAFTAQVYGHLSQDHRVKESDRMTGLFEVASQAKLIAIR